MVPKYINRDISWLSFNERVLEEAAAKDVPIAERLKFLSIYSSNLDEFSRVRIPLINALEQVKKKDTPELAKEVKVIMTRQQERFGKILQQVIKELDNIGIHFVYNNTIPLSITQATKEYFFSDIAAYIRIIYLQANSDFFPINNQIYLAVSFINNPSKLAIISIPSNYLPRFKTIVKNNQHYIISLDDILKSQLSFLFPKEEVNAYSFKVTRDAEMEIDDEFSGNLASKMEKELAKRDFGLATRVLYDKAMPKDFLQTLIAHLNLQNALIVKGGSYHNLKDLSLIKLTRPDATYEPWPPIVYPVKKHLLATIEQQDILLHLPFNSYNTVLRFFNESALDKEVTEISMTVYRLSSASIIAESLITAALAGKKVTVFVELKARFDEANNIAWAKKMKQAGVRIVYSIPDMKVHAKVVLVKKKTGNKLIYYGLLGTGNFNEVTAAFYTDHILMTADKNMLKDLEQLFKILKKKSQKVILKDWTPAQLLIAPFNLQQQFEKMVDREINHAKEGKFAEMVVKINNLEDKQMIDKLYEASNAGVKIELIVRGICRLIPGVKNKSEHITVRRIVDRFLEHGRIFRFHNDGSTEWYMGSSDWMTRNLYRRVEVCFPVKNKTLQAELDYILQLYLHDNQKAVLITAAAANKPITGTSGHHLRAQQEMYNWIKSKTKDAI